MTAGFETLRWREAGGRSPPALVLLDQTRLPEEERRIPCADVESVAEAIESLRVRGAPAIGVAAAYGVALGAWHGIGSGCMRATVDGAVERLGRTRPTAVNLFQALDRMDSALEEAAGLADVEVYHRLVAEARGLQAADADLCRRIGEHGAALLEDGDTVLTHCNAGALATAGWGTALGVVYAAAESGKRVHVYAGETRPLLQGARLTSWELQRRGIAVTVICDGAAGAVLRDRGVDCVITGSDRIAANGDVANKIGTYGLALMARARGIPLYVAAPTTTVDPELATGDRIPIEERAPEEISNGFGRATVPEGVSVYNPAFDVTPHELVSAIITEHGISRPPYAGSLPGPGKGA
ncbi:MAG: S-methyl-5-thioribose-1-phosphate isomerase [Gemmatimonadaceae bacterium]|nr:S-methyl-5-thioribose-1-phosphate isomerase [Gemmatimonadaceae bacterium]